MIKNQYLFYLIIYKTINIEDKHKTGILIWYNMEYKVDILIGENYNYGRNKITYRKSRKNK